MRIKLLILLLTLTNVHLYANKEYDVRENGNSFSYVDTLIVSPEIAYNNIQNWIVTNSSSYKASVQYEDREQKKMIVKSGVDYEEYDNVESYLVFDLTIELKEGRYRLLFNNIKEYSILHSVFLYGLGETGEDTVETDIVTISGYKKDTLTGAFIFFPEEEYNANNSLLLDLKNKQSSTKKKKELAQLENEIKKIESRQLIIDNWRDNYIKINRTINNYIVTISGQLNNNDDF